MVGFGGPNVAHTTKPREIDTAANRNLNSLMPWLKIDYTLKREATSEYARDYDERLAQPMPEFVYGAAARFHVVG